MSTWLTAEISVPAQSCVPMPSTIVVIQLDPEATLNDFQDESVHQAATALQTKKYVVYTQNILSFAQNSPWIKCQFRLIGRKPPRDDPQHGIEPSMCIPLLPNTQHSLGRTSLPFNKPLPWDSCYLHTFPELEMRVPRVDKDSSAATFVPAIMPVSTYDCGSCEDDRMRRCDLMDLLEDADRIYTPIPVNSENASVATGFESLVSPTCADTVEDVSSRLDSHCSEESEVDHGASVTDQGDNHSSDSAYSTKSMTQSVRSVRPHFTPDSEPEEVASAPCQEELQEHAETPSSLGDDFSSTHSSHTEPSLEEGTYSASPGSRSNRDDDSAISSHANSEWIRALLDYRPVFCTVPMVDVEYDLSAISDFGEPEELLAELAAIKAIEEAYYADKQEEAAMLEAHEATASVAEAPEKRSTYFKGISLRLRNLLTGLKSVSSQRGESKETAATTSDDKSQHKSEPRTAADEIREKWELENLQKESATPPPSRLFRLKARLVTARTRVGRTIRHVVCCA